MKRAVWMVVLVAALLAMAVVPAAAAGGKVQYRWNGSPFSLVGQVSAVDAALGTITVQVHQGNHLVKPYLKAEVSINTDAKTRFLKYSTTGCQVLAFEDVEVGAYVSVHGYLTIVDGNESYLASRVTVDVPLKALR